MASSLLSFCLLSSCLLVQAQVVQWDIEKRHVNPIPGLQRRAGTTFEEAIDNDKTTGGYFATVSVGNPPQNLTLQIDTGSSDVWVPWVNAPICTDTATGGCPLGTFDPKNSETLEVIGQGLFQIKYVDGSGASGDYISDEFEIGGAKLDNFTMGLAMKASVNFGLVGVGYAANEASIETINQEYPNLPIALNQAGMINSVAYSLWLNDLGSSTGNILFGGIDTEKYIGDLTRINIIKSSSEDNFTDFTVALTSITASSPSGTDTLTSSSFPIKTVLDSGTTLSYLPQDIAEQMWREVGATYTPATKSATLPCSFHSSPGSFSFGFAGDKGPRVNVTMDELVLDLETGRGPLYESGVFKGQEICDFGIQNYTGDVYILGDTFLRSAYVVYDLVNNEIGIAATDFNSTESHIVAFESSGAPIPSATTAPDQSEATKVPDSSTNEFKAADGFQGSASDNAAPAKGVMTSSFALVVFTMAFMLFEGNSFSVDL